MTAETLSIARRLSLQGEGVIVAAAAPAWRASRINPVEAFRHDG